MIKSTIQVTRTIPDVRNAIRGFRDSGLRIGFVPTMGALHDGHVSLIHKAKEHADEVVVSIFVNPTQFGPNEDFASYPRPVQKDLDICEEHGVSVVFHPDVNQMYFEEELIGIKAGVMAERLCGRTRPGHFDGVLQVVNKLFNIIKPDIAVFGQKDIQQLFLIRQMVQEFRMDIDIIMAPTLRESDGLAISSRNVYLTSEQRSKACKLYQALGTLEGFIKNGGRDLKEVISQQISLLKQSDLITDYISCVELPKLDEVTQIERNRRYILAGAVFAGKTRLIDNLIIHT